MKNYNLKDYNNIGALRSDFLADLNADFADLEISSNTYTDCEILEIERFTIFNEREDIVVSISCNAGIKDFCFRKAVESGLLILPQEKLDLFNAYFEKYDAAFVDWQEVIKESIIKARQEAEKEAKELAAKKAIYEAKQAELKAKEKLAKRIAKSQEKFARELKTKVSVDADPVEWLRNNTTSIIATVPTHLEKVFKAQFPDAEYNLVDSSRKTSGGYSMKWSCDFRLTLKKDATNIPSSLAIYIKDNKIHNTSLIATLVRDEDFKFGKCS